MKLFQVTVIKPRAHKARTRFMQRFVVLANTSDEAVSMVDEEKGASWRDKCDTSAEPVQGRIANCGSWMVRA